MKSISKLKEERKKEVQNNTKHGVTGALNATISYRIIRQYPKHKEKAVGKNQFLSNADKIPIFL